MKVSVKAGLVLASLWIIFKMIVFYMGESEAGFKVGIFLNILFVLLAAAIGLYFTKIKSPPSFFLQDVKVCLRGSIVYTVIISAFVYMYYEKIDPFVMQNRIDEKVAYAEMQASENFKEIKAQTPGLKKDNPEQYVEKVRKDSELLHSGFVQSTFSLIALMLASIIYAFLVTFVMRKIIFRQ